MSVSNQSGAPTVPKKITFPVASVKKTAINKATFNQFYSTGPFKVTDATPIYYYGGHGSDVCDSITHIPIIKKVPDNCLYITITECGTESQLRFEEDETEENLFRFEENLEYLRHPNYLHYKSEIAKQLHVSPSAVHVHVPGDDYVLSYLSPFSFWSDENRNALAISGLVDTMKMIQQEKSAKRARPFEVNKKKTIFGSILGAKLIQIIDKTFSSKVTQKHARVLLERMKYPTRKPIHKYVYTEYQANKIISDLSFSIGKDTLLTYFESSVFPTRDQVDEILKKYVPYKSIFFGDDLHQLAETLDLVLSPFPQDNDRSILSNENLMSLFPGIHYNVVCRVVPPDCKIGLQRSMSSQGEQMRLGFIVEPERDSKGYDDINKAIKAILNRFDYPTFMDKRKAVLTTLESMSDKVIKLPDPEKKKLLKVLRYFGVVGKDDKENDLSKVIKYFVYPERYKYVRGSTRKQIGGIPKRRKTYKK